MEKYKTRSSEQVTLINAQGDRVGGAEKQLTHEQGWLHAAFSIIIFDSVKHPQKMLLQKRHPDKYHSGGLWSNACCGHPRPEEDIVFAAYRRLEEELGILTPLTLLGHITYCLPVGNGLIEHEHNKIFMGEWSIKSSMTPDPLEIVAWQWENISDIRSQIKKNPQKYTAWFPFVIDVMDRKVTQVYNNE